MGTTWLNLYTACRALAKMPGLSALALGALALGIGIHPAIFGLANDMLLRRLPVREPGLIEPAGRSPVDFAWDMDVTSPAAPNGRRVKTQAVTGEYFRTRGVQPALGRLIEPQDEGRRVAVLTWECWKLRFGAQIRVVGRAIELNGATFTVIGVAPPGFQHPDGIDGPQMFVLKNATAGS